MILPSIAKCAGVLLSVIATLADADLIIDDTCTTAQKATLNAAFLTAQSVANKGLIRTEAIDTDDLEASDISIEEVNRVNRLMTAFFAVDPMDPDYSTALTGVGYNLGVLSQVSESDMPKIWCGTPTTTTDDPNPSGKYVKYTTDPETGDPITLNGQPSFIWISFIFGEDKPFQFGEEGEEICDDNPNELVKAYSDGEVPGEEYIIFCQYGLTLPGWNALPTTFAGRSADLSAYPGTPLTHMETNQEGDLLVVVEGNGPNTLKYYLADVSMTLLHEMHHIFLDGIDATLGTPILVGGQYLRVAYGYIGTTALANQGYSPAIAANPDSCVMFALGCYLLGNDWSLNRAWPLQPPLPDLSVVGDQTMRRRRRREQTSARRERQHSRRDGITNWRETNRRRGLREIFAERGISDAHNHTHRGTH